MHFKGKIVWITGASSGIGEALAKSLAKSQSLLVLSARRKSELDRVRVEAGLSRDQCLVLPMDLSKHAWFPSAVRQVKKRFGRLDLLINNGGVSQRAAARDTTVATSKKIFDVNFFGAAALTSEALSLMGPGSRVAVISSIAGRVGTPLRSTYAASKHAVNGYFDSLRAELWKEGIGVTIIMPGYVRTNVSLNAMTGVGAKHGEMDDGVAGGMPAEQMAEMILSSIERGKDQAVLARGKERLAAALARLSPWLLARIIRRAKVT